MASETGFDLHSAAGAAGIALVVGQSHLGMAGLRAADSLVRHLGLAQIGTLSPSLLPAISPSKRASRPTTAGCTPSRGRPCSLSSANCSSRSLPAGPRRSADGVGGRRSSRRDRRPPRRPVPRRRPRSVHVPNARRRRAGGWRRRHPDAPAGGRTSRRPRPPKGPRIRLRNRRRRDGTQRDRRAAQAVPRTARRAAAGGAGEEALTSHDDPEERMDEEPASGAEAL